MALEGASLMPDFRSLQDLVNVLFSKISLLQQLLVIRSAATSSSSADLASLDIVVRGLENQLEVIKAHMRSEAEALPKAKALIGLSLHQERRLQSIFANLPTHLPGTDQCSYSEQASNSAEMEHGHGASTAKSTDLAAQKEKKGRNPPPRWYVTVDELESLSSYMRGRLTLEKINAAVDEMAGYAEANAKLLVVPRKKLGDDVLEKVLELRDFAASEAVKGKHFFFESDMRGLVLKPDNTGKAILTVLRHLNRISDVRTGRQRAFILAKH